MEIDEACFYGQTPFRTGRMPVTFSGRNGPDAHYVQNGPDAHYVQKMINQHKRGLGLKMIVILVDLNNLLNRHIVYYWSLRYVTS